MNQRGATGLLVFMTGATAYGWHVNRTLKEHRERNISMSKTKFVLIRSVPFRSISSLTGRLADCQVPKIFRKPIYSSYAYLFRCNLRECEKALDEYPTFNEFFSRKLKDGSRVFESASLTSPCDGTLVDCCSFSSASPPASLSLKGVNYKWSDLIDSSHFEKPRPFWYSLKSFFWGKPEPKHYCATIYLAPGDYHRFHAPCDMLVDRAMVVEGERVPVAPLFVKKILPEALAINQRAIISGTLQQNSSSKIVVVPVGSTNVSSLKLNDINGAKVKRGEELGKFCMGSTVMMVFSSTDDHEWVKEPGSKVALGEALIK